ncbi:MAG: hypothetical protein PVI12_03000 [Gammaproteobacteria bacterium]
MPVNPDPEVRSYFLLAAFFRGVVFFFADDLRTADFLAAVFRLAVDFFFAAGFFVADDFFFAADFFPVVFLAAFRFRVSAAFCAAIRRFTPATSSLTSSSTAAAVRATALPALATLAFTVGISFLIRRPISLAPSSRVLSTAASFCFREVFFFEIFFFTLDFLADAFLVAIGVSCWACPQ